MLKPEFTGQFKRDYKLALKRGCDPKKLNEVVMLLCKEEPLPEAYRDHALLTLPTAKAGGFLVRRSRPASRTYTVSPSV